MTTENLLAAARRRIAGRKLRLVLPEHDEPRIVAAAERLASEDLAKILFIEPGDPPSNEIAIVQSRRPKLSAGMAARLLSRPIYRAGAILATGGADAMLAGAAHTTAQVIEAALMTVGLAPGIGTPSSFFLMQWPGRQLLFADCAVNIQPDSQTLADIAIASAASAAFLFETDPRVALLSFSTAGSGGNHPDAGKVRQAVEIARSRRPDLKIDGELQGDAALSLDVAARKLKRHSSVAGQADVLIFPDLDAGNIAYKLAQYLGGAQAVGPVLQGFAKPVSDLSRGAGVDEIVATACLLLSMCRV